MFFRLLLTSLLVYVGYKFIKGFFVQEDQKEEVKGDQTKQPLDLKDADVSDARYEDVSDSD